jgi:hypothetical protein
VPAPASLDEPPLPVTFSSTLEVIKEVNRMARSQEIFYAVVGAGDLAVEKVRGISKLADQKATQKYYRDFVKRGRSLTTSIKNSAPTKRAVAQTKSARTQVKAATTSISKAVRLNARATQSAAKKTAKAS